MQTNKDRLLEYHLEKENQERIEHRDTLLAIRDLLETKSGVQLFEYLFNNLEVVTLPEKGLEGEALHDRLGFLRAGNSIYKLACEANSEKAAHILAKLERKRYEQLYEQHRIENGYYDEPDSDE